jgi:hypothetical protein
LLSFVLLSLLSQFHLWKYRPNENADQNNPYKISVGIPNKQWMEHMEGNIIVVECSFTKININWDINMKLKFVTACPPPGFISPPHCFYSLQALLCYSKCVINTCLFSCLWLTCLFYTNTRLKRAPMYCITPPPLYKPIKNCLPKNISPGLIVRGLPDSWLATNPWELEDN